MLVSRIHTVVIYNANLAQTLTDLVAIRPPRAEVGRIARIGRLVGVAGRHSKARQAGRRGSSPVTRTVVRHPTVTPEL